MAAKDLKRDDLFNKLAERAGKQGYSCVSAVMDRIDFARAAKAGLETQPPMIQPIRDWLEGQADRPPKDGPICACCEADIPFTSSDPYTWPEKFVVMYPNGAQAKDIGQRMVCTVSGVCPEHSKLEDVELLHTFCKKLPGGSWTPGEIETL